MNNGAAARQNDDVFYYFRRGWYKGSKPTFYPSDEIPGTELLQENFPAIKQEVESYFAAKGSEIKANYTPYSYRETGWRTVNLYSYFLRYPRNCEKFPVIDSIVRRIPGMCMTQVAVLDPHTRIKAHFGDTDAIVRTHLGLTIPGKLPELGFRLRRQDVAWEEGKLFSFCIAHRHYAWNYTDKPRLVLLVDTMREDYLDRRYEIASKALAAIAMKAFATKFPALKKMPRAALGAVHPALGAVFRSILLMQRTLALPVEEVVRLKFD